jgi:myo-inositol-1(or 4)-monophosphatase
MRKDLLDVVTDADLAAEAVVLAGIRRLTPDAAILSEEAGASGGDAPERWIVDPLDGTVNYAAGLPWFSVTLAYQRHGATRAGIVHAPAMNLVATWAEGEGAVVAGRPARVSATRHLSDAVVSVVLTSHFDKRTVARTTEIIRRLGAASRGVRVIVSGGLEMCVVASGQLDGFVSLKADIVSHAAAMPLLRHAGGLITRPDGTRATDDDAERIASNGHLHTALLDLLQDV